MRGQEIRESQKAQEKAKPFRSMATPIAAAAAAAAAVVVAAAVAASGIPPRHIGSCAAAARHSTMSGPRWTRARSSTSPRAAGRRIEPPSPAAARRCRIGSTACRAGAEEAVAAAAVAAAAAAPALSFRCTGGYCGDEGLLAARVRSSVASDSSC